MTDRGAPKKKPLLIFEVLKTTPATLMCTATERAVLVQMVEAMNPAANGSLVWPSQDRIAALTGLGERTVRRALKSLCDLDLIKLHQRTPRITIYSINVGLIHRICTTGRSGQSESSDRPQGPVRPATGATVTGQSGRSIEQLTELPSEQRTLTISCSANLKPGDDPVQRKLALHGLVAGASRRLQSPAQEQPTDEKTGRAHGIASVGALAVKERPG